MLKENKTKVHIRKRALKFVSVRLEPELKFQFDELCRRKGLHVNQAYVRLLGYAVLKEWVPEHIEKPQLPGYNISPATNIPTLKD